VDAALNDWFFVMRFFWAPQGKLCERASRDRPQRSKKSRHKKCWQAKSFKRLAFFAYFFCNEKKVGENEVMVILSQIIVMQMNIGL
jgi:hypothetical protein